ncbi:MAG TPA: aminotransferase class V-fold PLP-dependent enzyme, partial [Vicinamibacterales bacterium]|nr:aminotransferase class V-fold PLP-dependent enzyme [Vicinamibacterales bacterium]
LDDVAARPVAGTATRASLLESLGGPLPQGPADPLAVLEALAENADPGIVATAGPRFFGFVTGGAVPVTVAADWLASAWDQNACLYVLSPAVAVMEDIVAGWILEMLDFPRQSSVGFVTGCHLANFTCLAAARHEVLRREGWNVETQGLQRAPRIRVIVGGEAHITAIGALRYLGFGSDELEIIPVDDQGRMRAEALATALATGSGPTIVCAQAGNVSTGASDPFDEIIATAHERGAWVHVDGAFGLWARVVPELRDQVRGIEKADSWATDAHKWLNVPYDSGLAIVADAAPHRAAMGLKASYLQRGADEERVGMDWVPDSSRRARILPLYALFRTLGRDGIADIVRRNCELARRMAETLSATPGITILNKVTLNQVLVQFKDDETTRRVIAAVQAEGTCWAGGAHWQGTQAMRISVSNWSTTEADIDQSADAIVRAFSSVSSSPASSSAAGPA